MGARPDYLNLHAWFWMQPWRVASSSRAARRDMRRKGSPHMTPDHEDGWAAARLGLPPGVLFASRLGLDLGIDTNLALGGRRQ